MSYFKENALLLQQERERRVLRQLL